MPIFYIGVSRALEGRKALPHVATLGSAGGCGQDGGSSSELSVEQAGAAIAACIHRTHFRSAAQAKTRNGLQALKGGHTRH